MNILNLVKIPRKYQTVITRLMNSENGKQKITDYMTGVGAESTTITSQ